jgi:hypothetical protein
MYWCIIIVIFSIIIDNEANIMMDPCVLLALLAVHASQFKITSNKLLSS